MSIHNQSANVKQKGKKKVTQKIKKIRALTNALDQFEYHVKTIYSAKFFTTPKQVHQLAEKTLLQGRPGPKNEYIKAY